MENRDVAHQVKERVRKALKILIMLRVVVFMTERELIYQAKRKARQVLRNPSLLIMAVVIVLRSGRQSGHQVRGRARLALKILMIRVVVLMTITGVLVAHQVKGSQDLGMLTIKVIVLVTKGGVVCQANRDAGPVLVAQTAVKEGKTCLPVQKQTVLIGKLGYCTFMVYKTGVSINFVFLLGISHSNF